LFCFGYLRQLIRRIKKGNPVILITNDCCGKHVDKATQKNASTCLLLFLTLAAFHNIFVSKN
jgi:hypothetical protein